MSKISLYIESFPEDLIANNPLTWSGSAADRGSREANLVYIYTQY